MKNRALSLLPLLALLLILGRAQALELSAGRINPFADNTLTVVSDQPGLLTIHVPGYMDAVTGLAIDVGTTELTWRALSWNDEPLTQGLIRLTAELTLDDGTVQTAFKQVRIRQARSVVRYCLPEHSSWVIGGASLRVEVGVNFICREHIELVSVREGSEPVWVWNGQSPGDKTIHIITWDWGRPKAPLEPGEYVLRAWSFACPGQVSEAPVTLTAEEDAPQALFLTGSVLPEDPDDDEAVWAAITAPAVVATGFEQTKLHILAQRDRRAEVVADVYHATVALTVLELFDDGWARVGVWNHGGGEYTEGYVRQDQLTVVVPNTRYGLVVDKRTQTLRVYENGRRIGSVRVSTGLQVSGEHILHSETRAGAFLVGSRWASFASEGFTYQYPFRIDGPNLIHQVGWRTRSGLADGLAEQTPLLGTRASHGCIRVDNTPGEGGINAYWLWTHLAHNTKVLVIDDPETRHARMDELGIPY